MTKSPESPPQDDEFQPQQVIPAIGSDSKYVQKSISALTFSTNSQDDITYSDNNGSGHNIDNDIDTYGTAHDRIEDLEGAQLPPPNKKLSWGINNGDNSVNLPNTPDRNSSSMSTQKARGSVVTFATAKQSIHHRPVYRASLESDQSPEEQFLYIKKNTNDSNRSGHSDESIDSKGMPKRWGFKRNISHRRNSRPSVDSTDSRGVPIAWSRMSTVGGATVGGTTRGGAGGIQFHQIPTMSIAPGVSFQNNQSVAYSIGQSKRPSEGPMQVEYLEAITLPQSTHTLLFTEHVFSLPFGFAFLILILSIGCLALALTDNLDGGTSDNPLKVPPNVSLSVRIAQYFSIVVAVLMEEEIPTALYLLRMIPRSSLEAQLGLSYTKFCASAMCRLVIGYMFLFNVLLVVVQSERVLDMFYDMVRYNTS